MTIAFVGWVVDQRDESFQALEGKLQRCGLPRGAMVLLVFTVTPLVLVFFE